MTVSDYIFDFLNKKGADTVFMVSGSTAMWLVDALKRNENFKVVCNHHEQASTMAAEVYARVSGKIGVSLVTAGPGVMNALTGVAGAWTDSVPTIVISGQSASRLVKYEEETGIRQHGTQGINIRPIVEPITKYFEVIDEPSKIRYCLEKAYHTANDGRPGPVWLDIPINVQNMQVPDEMVGFEPETIIVEHDSIKVDKVWDLLKKSKRPLILAGHGVEIAGAKKELKSLYTKLNIPVVTSRLGIDLIETENPLFTGRPGSYGDRPSHFAIQNADFMLILGSRLSVATIGYHPSRFGVNAKKVLVDIDCLELNKSDVPIDFKIQKDCKEFLIELLEQIDESEMEDISKWQKQCISWRNEYPVVRQAYQEKEGLNSYYVTKQISNYTKEGDVIVVDTGTCCNVVSQSFQIKENQKYIISGGMSCMGYWAGAIGACMATDRSKNVIAIAGDGSLQMNIQELATMKYNKLKMKLFIYSNQGYLLIRLNQHNFMNDRFLGVGPDSGLEMPNIIDVAKAYGIKSVKIETNKELDIKIQEVLDYDGPVLCEILTPQFQTLEPRIASKEMPDGSLLASEYDDLFPFLSEEELERNRLNK